MSGVSRAEYERLRDATDAIYRDLLRYAAELEAENRALREEISSLHEVYDS